MREHCLCTVPEGGREYRLFGFGLQLFGDAGGLRYRWQVICSFDVAKGVVDRIVKKYE